MEDDETEDDGCKTMADIGIDARSSLQREIGDCNSRIGEHQGHGVGSREGPVWSHHQFSERNANEDHS